MDIEEIKKNMSLIDKLLEKNNTIIKVDTSRVKDAKTKIQNKYLKKFNGGLILFLVFSILWVSGGNDANIAFPYRIAISSFFLIDGIWNLYLYRNVKKIDIYNISPKNLFIKISELKMKVLNGEILIGVFTVALIALLLPQIYRHSLLGFWLVIACIIIASIYSVFIYIPRYKKILNELTAIQE